MSKWVLVVMDRDGGILNDDDEEMYDTEGEALKAGEFWECDWRYGSHEAEEVDE